MKNLLVVLFLLGTMNMSCQEVVGSMGDYVCPPCNSKCDEIEFAEPGTCPHCNMALITKAERSKIKTTDQMTIAFYLQSGVEVLDFAGPLEVFSYAGFQIFTVSKTTDPILSQGVLKIIPDYSIDNAPRADILAFFGGNGEQSFSDSEVINWIKKQEDIQYHFSVCTGAFALAEAGILSGMTATTFHLALDNFEKKYKDTKVVRDARFVDNGKVITTAGISAGIDGALHFVSKIQGVEAAKAIAYNMEYDKWIPEEGLIIEEE